LLTPPRTTLPVAATRVLSIEKLRYALLWLMGFAGAFVFIEPGPYEVVGAITIGFFLLTGVSMSAGIMPLVLLLIILDIGYATALIQVIEDPKLILWVLVSVFLALTGMFYAAILDTNTQARLDRLLRGYLAGALIASLIAIGAYFHLFGERSEMFLLYGRARGTFNDPNVLGAFLVLPAALLFQRVLGGRLSAVLGSGSLLLVLLAALLLTFSRGAWGQFLFVAAALMMLTFLTSNRPAERLRIVLIASIGIIVLALFVLALLSIGGVADLFKERASLEQSYDLGYLGRFHRYILGFQLALDRPFGLGPLGFAKIFFPEDPHNTFLNTFMSGGWLAGLAYLTLTTVTVVRGFRFALVRTPWQPTYHLIYAAFLGTVGESAIVDIDHWRHYFLMLGLLWGLMAVSRPYLARSPVPA
jgi:O-antigen ligase